MLPNSLYSLVFYLLTPFICLRLLWRGRKVPGYRHRWRERFGFVSPVAGDTGVIWVHAVSVGEAIAAVPLIRRLQSRYPGTCIAVTTTTPTGSDRVVAMLGDSVYHSFAPYDLPDANRRFLDRIHPRMVIIMETELWPNLVSQCYRRGIPVVLANARMSEKSAAGYRRFHWLTEPMLKRLAAVAAQDVDDGERFRTLGLPDDRLHVTGNIKFDLEISADQKRRAQALSEQWRGHGRRPVWVAASTHRGEDDIVLSAFGRALETVPELLLVLVPRHPDRFDEVAQLCRARGFSFVRRGAGEAPSDDTRIVLGDTMGELPLFFGACDIALVAGSLVPVGGHNLMEPAAWGVPVLSGPHLFNFAEASRLLRDKGALEICRGEEDLATAVVGLLSDSPRRERQGSAGRDVVAANGGAMERLMALIVSSWV